MMIIIINVSGKETKNESKNEKRKIKEKINKKKERKEKRKNEKKEKKEAIPRKSALPEWSRGGERLERREERSQSVSYKLLFDETMFARYISNSVDIYFESK